MEMTLEKCSVVVLAICAIHNFLITRKSPCNSTATAFDHEVDGIFCPGAWREELEAVSSFESISTSHPGRARECAHAQEIRDKFLKYFALLVRFNGRMIL